MKTFHIGILAVVLMGFSLTACAQTGEEIFRSIGQSHVDANVPDKKDFDAFLKRDITAYVTDKKDKDIQVTVELLRDVPSQSGVALPKFYVWIEKRDAKGVLMEEAAARIAAVNRDHFDVIQYYDRDRILKEAKLVSEVFPADVYEKILKKVEQK